MHSTLPESNSCYDDAANKNHILGSEDTTQDRHLLCNILILFAQITECVATCSKRKALNSNSEATNAKQNNETKDCTQAFLRNN